MSIRVVRLGAPRAPDEGVRIGTVRRPPRGVPKAEFATRDYYDVWLPVLAPSDTLVKAIHAVTTDAQWHACERSFRAEMAKGDAGKVLDLLAALSHTSDFSVGCYCENETHCHRSVLRRLLESRGAAVLP
ncbi:DUF488 domain-containing protein [Burkholderia plantarii]|uniref:DUF488 domain-containing protein n=1 Tax=Burkholderia plantarii TaxID=41899 RepID=A0A0B6SAV4_BURPL|nr:DUF488 family protein [Burkholderia plantarii]AJK49351.1 hypothetical protein BGL_2c12820 [Burkholderia plantarii]ALK33591.1 hypothetical protein bpln_2g13610 [Burkholderia plantarii]WLE62612.1 DUF488 family protein [Burkholderia plantarii]GLZ16754.1 hypothetical protein Bpla01_02840 [Burkholderia plantarii]